tara:strand:+ start:245 stop:451 length:207 start_codon:yes stop_codon:yes gene_type:complete
MFIGTITLFIVAWAAYAIWSKLCDIEQKLFRMHDELSSSQKDIEQRIDTLESTIDRIDDNTDHTIRRL